MRDYTYRYSVRMTPISGYHTPSGWDTRSRAGRTVPAYLTGKPTDAKLARYVADYNDSLKPGGVNEHIGPSGYATKAVIFDHQTNTEVATWEEQRGSWPCPKCGGPCGYWNLPLGCGR